MEFSFFFVGILARCTSKPNDLRGSKCDLIDMKSRYFPGGTEENYANLKVAGVKAEFRFPRLNCVTAVLTR
jgi:hypothetical protein